MQDRTGKDLRIRWLQPARSGIKSLIGSVIVKRIALEHPASGKACILSEVVGCKVERFFASEGRLAVIASCEIVQAERRTRLRDRIIHQVENRIETVSRTRLKIELRAVERHLSRPDIYPVRRKIIRALVLRVKDGVFEVVVEAVERIRHAERKVLLGHIRKARLVSVRHLNRLVDILGFQAQGAQKRDEGQNVYLFHKALFH